ncbi:MFS transporter [Pseudonocardia spinosispora]|uniref:MFS transporter n=1 Tax=Pseudonocardia spinosispora TaxID=103441 RepID=UPI00040B0E91|nr:MFS transporter [Pseudonocardia spinosispora]
MRATTEQPVGAVFEDMRLRLPHIRAGAVLCIAFVLEAWEMLALVYIGADVRRSLGIDEASLGLLVSALFLGMIPGSLISGVLADRIGRRRTCTWSLALYGVCTAVAAFASNYPWLLAARLLAGLMLSGVHVTVFPYFEELLPVRVRGKATVYLSSGWAFGLLLAVGTTSAVGGYGWRAVVFLNALVGLWALAIRMFVPESPYWLVASGRQAQARTVLRTLGAEVPDDVTLTVPEHRVGSVRAIFARPLRRITVTQIVLNFALSWGYWGLQTGLPELLRGKGLTVSATLGFTALSALMMIPGYLSASWLTHRYGRRRVFITYITSAAASGVLFAFAGTMPMLYVGNFLLAFFSLGAFGVWNTWLGEFYPTAVRGVGYSWGIFAQRVANTIAPTVIGLMLARATAFGTTVVFIDAFLLVSALLSVQLPETRDTRLD